MEDSKDEKNLLAGLNLHYVDAMALNDDEKGLSIELFGLIFSTTCLESGNAEFVFPKKFIRRFRKLFSTTLYLFFRGWWQIFVLLDARSQLLEVIFLLVKTEAQYNSDTINNILRSAWSNGAAVSLSCDVKNPEERVLRRNLGLQVLSRALIFLTNPNS